MWAISHVPTSMQMRLVLDPVRARKNENIMKNHLTWIVQAKMASHRVHSSQPIAGFAGRWSFWTASSKVFVCCVEQKTATLRSMCWLIRKAIQSSSIPPNNELSPPCCPNHPIKNTQRMEVNRPSCFFHYLH